MKRPFDKKSIFNILMLLLSVSMLVYFCVSENGLLDLIKSAKQFNKRWLITAVICHFLNILIDAFLIFRFVNTDKQFYSFKDAFKCCMVGQFFSAVTPGASGGQPMQVYSMSQKGLDPGRATSALVQKFLVYQSTITIYSALAIFFKSHLFKGEIMHLMRGILIFGFCSQAFVIIIILLFSFNKNLTYRIISQIFEYLSRLRIIKNKDKKMENMKSQLEYFHLNNSRLYKNQTLVLESYVLTAMQITCMFVVPYCIYRSFQFHGAKVFDMIASQAFVSVISAFMPLPGGSGAAEGGFLIFFGFFFTDQTIKPAVLLWRIITYFFTILISFPFSRISKKQDKGTYTINIS